MLVFVIIIVSTIVGFMAFLRLYRKYGENVIFVGPIVGVIVMMILSRITGLIGG